MSGIVLALDIGGTKLAAAVVDRGGAVLGWARAATPVDSGPRRVVDRLIELGRDALDAAGRGQPDAIGIACGGPLDQAAGVVLGAPNLPGWDRVPVTRWIEDAFGCRAFLENDASAAALGEARYGAGRGFNDLVYLTISTGIGGGVVLGGRLLRGSTGNAGELGHTTVAIAGRPCHCGRHGCLETYASGTAIAETMREALAARPGTAGEPLAPGEAGAEGRSGRLAGRSMGGITAKDVAAAVRAGDPIATRVWDDAMTALAAGVADLINTFDPELVVVGGGVVGAGDLLLEPVRRGALSQAWRPLAEHVEIRPAELGERTGVLGAAAVAWDALDADPEGAPRRLDAWIAEHRAVVDEIDGALGPAIEAAAVTIAETFAAGGRLLVFGNGGSAAEAQHLAAEFTGHLRRERRPLAAVALSTDTSALTAIGNDYAFEDVFARQVEALASPGDVVVAMTTSGRSPNVVRGLEAAGAAGAKTILLSGGDGGPAAGCADLAIVVTSSRSTARVQEAHGLIVHLVCELVDDHLLGEEALP